MVFPCLEVIRFEESKAAISTNGCNVIGRQFSGVDFGSEILIMVGNLCIVMRTVSLRPVTILPQICRGLCTKLRKHLNAIMEVLCCFTVAIGSPGDASDCNEDKRSAVVACMQNKMVVK